MKEFYQSLKQKREEKGITLETVHRRTYLPLNYLIAIESGNMEKLPPGYERLYLKRYTLSIGLDAEEVLRDYDMLCGRLSPTASGMDKLPRVEKEEVPSEIPSPKYRSAAKRHPLQSALRASQLNMGSLYKYFWISLAVLIIATTGFFTYRQYMHQKNNQVTIREIPSASLSQQLVAAKSFPAQENQIPAPADNEPFAPASSEVQTTFTVELKGIDTTWIRQIKDGTDTTEYTLPPGLRHKVEAKEQVKFIVGKADGVEFWLNGDKLGVMGKADEVVTSLIISEKGIIEKKLRKVIKKSATKVDSSIAVMPIL